MIEPEVMAVENPFGLTPRLYQETILATAVNKNTLVVLPTGLGKTFIAMMLAKNRLDNYPKSKVLFLSPTRPLVQQHHETFKEHYPIGEEKIAVFTGHVKPEKRKELWKNSQIIFSTPQGLENDIIARRINLADVSLLVVDEGHRTVGEYAYTFIAKQYHKKAKYERILALTASPGTDADSINEILKNLYVENIEVRTVDDPDVKEYVQDTDVKYVRIPFIPELQRVRNFLYDCYKSKLEEVKKYGYFYGSVANTNKMDVLKLQSSLQARMAKGERDFEVLKSVSLVAEAMKIQHAIELVETQGLTAVYEYLLDLQHKASTTKVKAVQNLVKDLNFRSALITTEKLLKQGIEHPKLEAVKKIIVKETHENPEAKIIIFNQYRDQIMKLKELLDSYLITCEVFVGQAKKKNSGLSQKEQKKVIQRFKEGEFNILLATSVAEEGLDIPAVDLVVFYEPVPSAIRTIQRRGRTGRQTKGRVLVLMTKGTRDEGYKWSSHHKEKRMYRILEKVRDKLVIRTRQQTLPETEFRLDNGDKIHMYIDHREKGSGIVKDLVEKGVEVDLTALDVGDYLLSSRVCVELKLVPDFVDSIIDGRLLQQLPDLKKYERPILIVQGDEDIYSQRKIHPNAIRAMLANITVSYGVPVIFTKSMMETSALLCVIAKREQAEDDSKDFTMHTAKPLSDKDLQEYIVGSLPGVGGALSKPLLRKFGSVKKVFTASEKELKEVEKIGKEKAKRIKDIVERNYDE